MSHIRKRVLADGTVSWQARASTYAGGSRKYVARNFASEREALAWARGQGALIESRGISGGKDSVASYFRRWCDHLDEAGKLEATTRAGYRFALGKITSLIGGIKLAKLSVADLDAAYAKLSRSGGLNGKPLSARSVHAIHRVVSNALRRARKWKLIADNPAQDAEPPSPGRSPARAPTPEQLAAYIQAARPTPYFLLIVTALATGLRRGELLGLRWADVDLDGKTLQVSQTMCQVRHEYWIRPKPKTPAGFRRIAIPDALVAELARLRLAQKEEMLASGSAYARHLDLVFCRAFGQPWQPTAINRRIGAIARAAGLPKSIRPLHGLRHRHASDLLAQDIALKVASERLGHSSIQLTGDLYTHVDDHLDRAAAAAVDKVLQPLLTKGER
jgi:integrase